MLDLIASLFGKDVLVLRGVAESHPASMLNSVLKCLGQTSDGQEDGPIDRDYLSRMAGDEKIERLYWQGWKELVLGLASELRLGQKTTFAAWEKIDQAESISFQERRMLELQRPAMLFMEGCAEYPSSVIGLVAQNQGTKVVYLDEGFQPYLDWQRSRFKTDLSYVQKGRESHWLSRVLKNKPRGMSLLIAGRSHLITPTRKEVLETPSRCYIGKFPDLLESERIRFSMYADLSRPGPGVRSAPALYRA